MIALFGLLQLGQMLFQLGGLGEGHAVHALQHLFGAVATPVGSGTVEQLNRLDAAGTHQMRAGAQIGEITLTVKGDVLTLAGVLIDELHLVDLAFLFHQGAGLLRGQLKPFQR